MPPSLSPEPSGEHHRNDQNSPSLPQQQQHHPHHHQQQQQPISKRDKKRSQLLEKIDDIIRTFSMNKDHEYRAQLQAIQVDINIILSIEPHRPEKVMEEHAEEIINLLMGYRGGDAEEFRKHMNDVRQLPNTGSIYAQFQQEVEEAEAARDAALAIHAHEYERNLRNLEYNAMFHTHTAKIEHKELSNSIRDRLINNIQMRKSKLTKEKESTEIADSNALLMHPNQYSITNPSSPGGIHGRRAKRHRADAEDLPGYAENKRKLKALQDVGSPAPSRRLYESDPFNKTTLWSTADIIKSSSNGVTPVFSIEKLFPDKDIQLVHNAASISGYEHIVRHQLADDVAEVDEDENDWEDEDAIIAAALANGSTGMERTNSHLTRSNRNGVQNGNIIPTGIDAIVGHMGAETARKIATTLPRLPPGAYLANEKMYKSYQKDAPNTPAGCYDNDLARDLARIKKAKEINARLGIGANLVDEELKDGELLAAASMPADRRREAPIAWLRSEEAVKNGGPTGRLRSGTPASRVGSAMGRRARYN